MYDSEVKWIPPGLSIEISRYVKIFLNRTPTRATITRFTNLGSLVSPAQLKTELPLLSRQKFPQRVRRRYNHFDWLHERLEEKYPNICIPPLPDKALKGNFEEDFIMKRKSQLELWLNRLSSHPVISESEVFIHFLQCDDTSAKWKAGKRKAEHDEYRGELQDSRADFGTQNFQNL